MALQIGKIIAGNYSYYEQKPLYRHGSWFHPYCFLAWLYVQSSRDELINQSCYGLVFTTILLRIIFQFCNLTCSFLSVKFIIVVIFLHHWIAQGCYAGIKIRSKQLFNKEAQCGVMTHEHLLYKTLCVFGQGWICFGSLCGSEHLVNNNVGVFNETLNLMDSQIYRDSRILLSYSKCLIAGPWKGKHIHGLTLALILKTIFSLQFSHSDCL